MIKSEKLKVIQISRVETKILSANKSNKAPKSEVWLFFRAKYPSKKSDIEANINIIRENK